MLRMDGVAADPREIVIEPSRGWLRIEWRELWEYRDLMVLLVQRDVISRYKQTLLGPLWFVLQPLLTTAVFVVIFGRIAGIPTDGIPGPLFYLCGLLGWNYFAQNITTGGACFVTNAHLFGKVWFPRLIVPIAAVISNLVALALQFAPFVACLCYFKMTGNAAGIHATSALLLLPLVIVHTAALSLGVALFMSAATGKYRDLIHLQQYIIQVWMFATPIVYPLSSVPEKWKWIVLVNPVSVNVECYRICLLGRGTVNGTELAISALWTIVLLLGGMVLFQRVARTVVDSV